MTTLWQEFAPDFLALPLVGIGTGGCHELAIRHPANQAPDDHCLNAGMMTTGLLGNGFA
jgi:hypothetical protein